MIKYGIGLTLMYMSKDEFKLILDDYHDHIDYIYYSSMIDPKFYARVLNTEELQKKFKSINPQDQYDLLDYARTKYGIKTELTVNSLYNVTNKEFIKMIRIESERHKPDKVVLLNDVSNDVKKYLPDSTQVYSYNNNLFNYEQIKTISNHISEVVVGNRFIRDENMYSIIKDNKRIPICLVNNGCSHNCGYCGSGTCDTAFLSNLCRLGIDIPYAIATLYPWEVRKINELFNVELFKLSTRTFNYTEVDYLLHIMINNINKPEDRNDTLLFTRALAPMYEWEPYYKYIDLLLVDQYKKELWKKLTLCGS